MPLSVPAFVGWRYLRFGRSNPFASFVSFASMVGVALGVAALITVLSVMNGFETELRGRLLSITGHATVETGESVAGWQPLLDDIRAYPGVQAAAPFVEIEGMVSTRGAIAGALFSGIRPRDERAFSDVGRHMVAGELAALTAGEFNLILGRAMARQLGVGVGDRVTVMVPQKRASGLRTELREFTVVGVFELGLRDHDSVRALLHLDDAAALMGTERVVSGIKLTVDDVFDAPSIVRGWLATQGREPGLAVRDWTVDNASYFRAIRIEKVMMTLLLSLVVAVAAFNIVAMLVMVVAEKRSGIAILRTLGFSSATVVQIFAFQGIVLGGAGVAAGAILGIVLASNVETLAPALERLFGFEFMPADVYYLTALPSELRVGDVAIIAGAALIITVVATFYPASRAAQVAPAEVLRYE